MLDTLKNWIAKRRPLRVSDFGKTVETINALGPALTQLSDEALKERAALYKRRVQSGEAILEIMPEWFALVREVSKRTIGLWHFDTQVLAGCVLAQGAIAEIATGEGKTLIATLPASLHALKNKGVHVVTVNQYLAQRDFASTSPVYQFLGLTTGLVTDDNTPEEKERAYAQTITFGTGYQFGFDYLRAQLSRLSEDTKPLGTQFKQTLYGLQKTKEASTAQGEAHRLADFVIIDEVDSVLLDEGHTPLLIAGRKEGLHPNPEVFFTAQAIAEKLEVEKDYEIFSQDRILKFTDSGEEKLYQYAKGIGLSKGLKRPFNQYVSAALKAQYFFQKDIHYLIDDKQAVVIIDQNTGRAFKERSWKNGLHQAVEAKERVPINQENESLASITRQRYFNLYSNKCGMTGTAAENKLEFQSCFELAFVRVPLNKPSQEKRYRTRVFKTWNQMLAAIAQAIAIEHKKGRPILVGTRSVEASVIVAKEIEKLQFPVAVLNAKQDLEEAKIVEKAGQLGTITIATNMAGRGTHIQVEERALELGGLHVIAVEMNESARIDRQLFGRTARQGQVGSFQLFVSLEDSIIERYAPEQAAKLLKIETDTTGELPESCEKLFSETQAYIEREHTFMRKQLIASDAWLDELKSNL